MEGQIKQAVLEALRMGADPLAIRQYLDKLAETVIRAARYKPNDDIADFYQAIRDSDFRP